MTKEENTFQNITVKYSDKLVQITCDKFLKDYLEEKGNGALKLSSHILDTYRRYIGKPLKISLDSLAIEILAHTYVDSFSEVISSLGDLMPETLERAIEKLTHSIRLRTEIIDCGEADIDNNRWIWNALTPFKKIIYSVLGDRA